MNMESSKGVSKIVEQFGIANRNLDSRIEASLCFAITFFYEGSLQDNKKGILAFYNWAMEHLSDKVKFTDTDGRFRPRKFRETDTQLLLNWLESPAPTVPAYGLIFNCGERKLDISTHSLHLYHSGLLYPAFLRLTLSIDEVLGDTEAVVRSAITAAEHLNLLTGYAGICLATYLYGAWTEEGPLFKLSNRFSGVDFADPYRFREYQAFGINCANWLTWIGEKFLDRLPHGYDQDPPKGVKIYQSGKARVFRAGAKPMFGSVNEQEDMDTYFAVGRLLDKAKFPSEKLGRNGCIGGLENTLRWLGRFDG
jgi:hypothetical protein